MARRSPKRSASAPKTGCPKPQARFWIAIASEKSDRGQPKASEIGIWKTPKVARMPNPSIRIRQLAISTGDRSEVLVSVIGKHSGSDLGRWRSLSPASNPILLPRPSPSVMAGTPS